MKKIIVAAVAAAALFSGCAARPAPAPAPAPVEPGVVTQTVYTRRDPSDPDYIVNARTAAARTAKINKHTQNIIGG